MELFLTIEAQNATETGISDILSEINKQLSFVTERNNGLENSDNYGKEFSIISIIPTCVDDHYWDALGWKERVLISRKNKEADVRLRIEYTKFINSTTEKRRLLFIDTIIKSIQIVKDRSKGDFKGDKLIDDILSALKVTKFQLANI